MILGHPSDMGQKSHAEGTPDFWVKISFETFNQCRENSVDGRMHLDMDAPRYA